MTIIKQNYIIESGEQKEPQKRIVSDWEWPKGHSLLFATHQIFFQAELTYSKFGILKITVQAPVQKAVEHSRYDIPVSDAMNSMHQDG